MSGARQRHAIAAFLHDVFEPIETRRRRAAADGCDWRVQWSDGEAIEARRFMLLGRALGLFDPDAVEHLLAHWVRRFETAHERGDWQQSAHQRTELYRMDAMLESAQPLSLPDDADDRRALWRSRGLLQSNMLASSRLGHGQAAEALARLSYGDPMSCLQPLAALATSDDVRRPARRLLLACLDSPDGPPPASRSASGPALAASVFQATQYLWTLGFMHEDKHVATVDTLPWPDPLQLATGYSVANALHLAQYWRFDFHRERFESDLFEAVDLAARVLFRVDPGLGRSETSVGADDEDHRDTDGDAFARDFRARFERVSKAWKAIFAVQHAYAYDDSENGARLA